MMTEGILGSLRESKGVCFWAIVVTTDPSGDEAGENQTHSSRLLEYADLALGVKKIEP